MKQGRNTTKEERLEIVKDCLASEKNYGETALRYKVSYQQVRTWTLPFEELGEANLRSRGDGPSASGASTVIVRLVQTSAHAEMDLLDDAAHAQEPPNLRSRGDGPGRADGACPQRSKPPHTRRWAPKSDGRTCGLTLRTYPPVVVSYDSSLNVDVGNRCPWQRKWIRNRGQLSQAHFCELLADV